MSVDTFWILLLCGGVFLKNVFLSLNIFGINVLSCFWGTHTK